MVEQRASRVQIAQGNLEYARMHELFQEGLTLTREPINYQKARELADSAVNVARFLGPNGEPAKLREAAAAAKTAVRIIKGKDYYLNMGSSFGKSWKEITGWPEDVKVPTPWKAEGKGNAAKRSKRYWKESSVSRRERDRSSRSWNKNSY